MTTPRSARPLVAAVATLALAGTTLGVGASTAFAAAKPKPKPKPAKVHHKAVKKATHKAKATTTPARAAAGVVTSVNAKSHALTVRVGKAADTFATSPATKVTDLGKAAAITALKAGEHVRVTYTGTTMPFAATTIAITKA